MWESCRTMPLVGGVFSWISRSPRPCIPALLHTRLASPSSALKTSLDSCYHSSTPSIRSGFSGAQQFFFPKWTPLALCPRQRHSQAGGLSARCSVIEGGEFPSGPIQLASFQSLPSLAVSQKENIQQLASKARATPLQSHLHLAQGTTVAEWLDCSPPTKEKPGLIPGLLTPDFRKWESCPKMPLVVRVFSGISPFPLAPFIPALLHTRLTSPSPALKTSRR
ncbi:hypothetical protein PR048_032351 [Dryococelus australis]|uniref:Uncharacterized protein n=1 Tax=Dryococelus australis TaxID=614101 RepID=A0ABQ9G2T2_9NEOP|nr:hypothetical protein PR048_032351 [Dryococelus australis]